MHHSLAVRTPPRVCTYKYIDVSRYTRENTLSDCLRHLVETLCIITLPDVHESEHSSIYLKKRKMTSQLRDREMTRNSSLQAGFDASVVRVFIRALH